MNLSLAERQPFRIWLGNLIRAQRGSPRRAWLATAHDFGNKRYGHHRPREQTAHQPAQRKRLLIAATLIALGWNIAPAAAQTAIAACTHIGRPGLYRLTQDLTHVAGKQSPECYLFVP
jgi:hypothetical protein